MPSDPETPRSTPPPLKQRVTTRWPFAAKAIAAVAALTGLLAVTANVLGAYGDIRNGVRQVVCDAGGLVGAGDPFGWCAPAGSGLSYEELEKEYRYLKARADTLSDTDRARLDELERELTTIRKVVNELIPAGRTVDDAAAADTREAATELATGGDATERRALELIERGETEAGLDLLAQAATEASAAAVEKWRRIGRLAYPTDTRRALDAYRKVVALDGSQPWDSIYLGRLQERIGDLTAAERTNTAALDRLPGDAERTEIILRAERGDILKAQGNLDAALDSYQGALKAFETLANADPSNTQWQRDLSVAHDRIGDIRKAQGKLDAALVSYRDSLDIARRLADADPSNTQWQRDLAVAHERIGDIRKAQGKLDAALDSYRESLDIARRLADADPSNTQWQRDLSVAHDRIGDIRKAQGKLDAALESYRESLDIRRRLADADPSNAEWQRDVIVSLAKLAGLPNGDTTWDQVADRVEALHESGRLSPADRWMLEEARRRADADGSTD